jgi:RNA polymerase sigma-70 factor (family 1)
MQKASLNITDQYFHSFRQGNEHAFASLFKLYYKPLLLFATKLLKEVDASEDVVTVAFTKLWYKRESIERAEAIKSYLYTSVRNSCLNRIRNEKRIKKKKKIFSIQQSWDEPVLHHLIRAETLHEISRGYEMLPPQCAKVFQLFYLQGKDYETIAEEMKLSISTIRNQKRRALQLIRSTMHFFLLLNFVDFL